VAAEAILLSWCGYAVSAHVEGVSSAAMGVASRRLLLQHAYEGALLAPAREVASFGAGHRDSVLATQ